MTEDQFSELLCKASRYFSVFDGQDHWIPAQKSVLHDVLEKYIRLDMSGREYALEEFGWGDDEFNDFWTFLPNGYLWDYCSVLEDSLSFMTTPEYLEELHKCINEPHAYDPWNGDTICEDNLNHDFDSAMMTESPSNG
jgi:hypothetical protein